MEKQYLFSMDEELDIWRSPEKWNIMDERGNVYKQEELIYENSCMHKIRTA